MLTEISAQYNRINRENFMITPHVRQPGKSLPVINQSENAEQQKGNHMESRMSKIMATTISVLGSYVNII
jgi:hypothetical protein